MSIHVEWANPQKTVIMYQFSDPWGWEEYYKMADRGHEMVASVDHKVTTIIDLSKSFAMPPGALTHMRRVNREHPNQGLVILVGLSSFIRAMSNVMMRLYPKAAQKVRIVATVDEAFAIVTEKQSKNG